MASTWSRRRSACSVIESMLDSGRRKISALTAKSRFRMASLNDLKGCVRQTITYYGFKGNPFTRLTQPSHCIGCVRVWLFKASIYNDRCAISFRIRPIPKWSDPKWYLFTRFESNNHHDNERVGFCRRPPTRKTRFHGARRHLSGVRTYRHLHV